MKVQVLVKTHARKNSVVVREDGSLFVCVTVPPVEGKANEQVIALLAKYFRKPKTAIAIVGGKHSKRKLVEIS